MDIHVIPICAQFYYAYGESSYANFCLPPRMHMGSHRKHTRTRFWHISNLSLSNVLSKIFLSAHIKKHHRCCIICAVRIQRVTLILVCIWGLPKKGSLYAYGDLCNARMHTGIIQPLNICIWEIFPYGKSSFVSSYTNFPIQGLPYAYEDPPVCIRAGIAVCIWGSPYAFGRGLLRSLHMGIPVCILKLCAYED